MLNETNANGIFHLIHPKGRTAVFRVYGSQAIVLGFDGEGGRQETLTTREDARATFRILSHLGYERDAEMDDDAAERLGEVYAEAGSEFSFGGGDCFDSTRVAREAERHAILGSHAGEFNP